MKIAKIIVVSLISLFFIDFSSANVRRVTSITDGNPNALRAKISASAAGDTVLIDVKGVYILNSTLIVDKSITIIGPFPKHFTISSSGLGLGNNAVEVTADNAVIQGIAFKGANGLNYLKIDDANNVRIEYCVFRDKSATSGGAVLVDGNNIQADIYSNSFYNNSTTGTKSAGLIIESTADVNIVNCTFSNDTINNSTPTGGSAIYINGGANYDIVHSTIYRNFGGASAIYYNGPSLQINMAKSILVDNMPYGYTFVSAPSVAVTNGNNVIGNSEIVSGITISPFDEAISMPSDAGIEPAIFSDGFGFLYHPITDSLSPAVDINEPTAPAPLITPNKDGRMMPRNQFGNVTSYTYSDAGAIEFSPYYVNNIGGDLATSHSLGWSIEKINVASNTAQPGPYVIDFSQVPPSDKVIGQFEAYSTITKDSVYINGFTHDSSAIPGPNTPSATSLTSAFTGMELANATTGPSSYVGLAFSGNHNFIWGMSISGHSTYIINLLGDDCEVFGCHLGGDNYGNSKSSAPTAVRVSGNNSRIGAGFWQWKRNVIAGDDALRNVFISGTGNSIKNNYIGFDSDGVNGAPGNSSHVGVNCGNISMDNYIGGGSFLEGNRFGAAVNAISVQGTNTEILGNWFGLRFDGVATANSGGSPQQRAILASSQGSNLRVGGSSYYSKNFFTAYDNGIFLLNFNSDIIVNNCFGLDTTGNFEVGTIAEPITVSGGQNVLIGNSVSGGNVIAQASTQGVLIQDGADQVSILNNLIGLKADSTFSSGIQNGITLIGNTLNNLGNINVGQPGLGNTIGQAALELIKIENFSSSDTIKIQSNLLGENASGTAQSSLPKGILTDGSTGPVMIGNINDPGNSYGNTIKNNQIGVLVGALNDSNVIIAGNSIYNNNDLGIDIYGSSPTGVTVNDSTFISSYGNNGIDYPNILSAQNCGDSLEVQMEIALPADDYIVEIFQNSIPDPTGFGEGEIFLSRATVTTTTNPDTVVVTVAPLSIGDTVSSTLSKKGVGTSEFSKNFGVQQSLNPSYSIVDSSCVSDANGEVTVTDANAVSFGINPGTTVSTGGSYTFSNLAAGVYTVTTDYTGSCIIDTTVIIDPVPLDDSSFTYPNFCANAPIAASNIATPGGAFSLYDYSGSASIDSTTGLITNSVADSTYEVVYLTSGCPNSDTVSVEALSVPNAPILSMDTTRYCSGDSIDTAIVENYINANSYSWFLNGTDVTASANINEYVPNNLGLGLNSVSIVVDSSNCSDTTQIDLYFADSSLINVPNSLSACAGKDLTLPVQGGDIFDWTGPYDFSDNTIQNPVITVNESGEVMVTIIDTAGCKYDRTINIGLEDPSNCDIVVFNAFSPNDDGQNDIWAIEGIIGKENKVFIYNRWGDRLRKFENYNNQDVAWDGTNKKGQNLPHGTYYYVIELNDQKMSGWIELMR